MYHLKRVRIKVKDYVNNASQFSHAQHAQWHKARWSR